MTQPITKRIGHLAWLVVLAAVLTSMIGAAAAVAANNTESSSGEIYSPDLDRKITGKQVRWVGRRDATWFGPGFYGHRTACGRKLKRSTWGIAHPSLKCGTRVVLRFHGETVSVPVIDRGPYSGADIDATPAVADRLGFKDLGHGVVRMGVVKGKRHG